MVPRGSNGAGQAILDTRALASHDDPVRALTTYDTQRREATAEVVRLNRTNPPDAILREVYERTGDQPFSQISDVITDAELTAILDRYRTVAGYSRTRLR